MTMRVVGNSFEASKRSGAKKSVWADAPIGVKLFMAKGIDYRLNTDNSQESKIPKEGSVRSSLAQYAKNNGMKVSIHTGIDTETKAPGLGFAFYTSKIPNPFLVVAGTTESNSNGSTSDSSANTGTSSEAVSPANASKATLGA